MTSATVPGYEVLIGCVVVMLALWVWMAIHFRNIIADELPTRLRRSLRIHFWRKKSGSSEYEAAEGSHFVDLGSFLFTPISLVNPGVLW
jgi:hypothetical protein